MEEYTELCTKHSTIAFNIKNNLSHPSMQVFLGSPGIQVAYGVIGVADWSGDPVMIRHILRLEIRDSGRIGR